MARRRLENYGEKSNIIVKTLDHCAHGIYEIIYNTMAVVCTSLLLRRV